MFIYVNVSDDINIIYRLIRLLINISFTPIILIIIIKVFLKGIPKVILFLFLIKITPIQCFLGDSQKNWYFGTYLLVYLFISIYFLNLNL